MLAYFISYGCSLIIQNKFHGCILGLETERFVEGAGERVAFPYVQGDVVAALFRGICFDVFEQGLADVLSADILIHAYIIYVERGYLFETPAALVLDGAEGVA